MQLLHALQCCKRMECLTFLCLFVKKPKVLPFVYLCRIILYAIAMVDYDQDAGESCKDVLKTRDGIDRLALYHSSVGR